VVYFAYMEARHLPAKERREAMENERRTESIFARSCAGAGSAAHSRWPRGPGRARRGQGPAPGLVSQALEIPESRGERGSLRSICGRFYCTGHS